MKNSLWRLSTPSPWILASSLGLALAATRAIGMLGPSSYRWIMPLGFVVMIASPWILLKGAGRRAIGLTRPSSALSILVAITLGSLAASICFAVGNFLFGPTIDNWFITVSNFYRQTPHPPDLHIVQLHLLFTVPALIFSPLGEEIYFRGILQQALEERFSSITATITECLAFGIVHLCHHGLIRTAAGFEFLPVSGPIWIVLMFASAFLFAWLRKRYQSLIPAILAHAAFNFCMNLYIFAFLW